MAIRATLLSRGPNFPDGDGDAMPERTSHQDQTTNLKLTSIRWLKPRGRFYVGSNNFLYYNPLNQHDNAAPDVYVVLDVEEREREKYQTWDEGGKFPDLIFEILSPKTRKEDLSTKKDLYARLGAREYFVHDPRPHIPKRMTVGWRLVDGSYQPIPRFPSGGFFSEVLGLELRVIGRWLRLIDPVSNEPIPWPEEETEARMAAEARVDRETARATREAARATREATARQHAEAQTAREATARQAAEARIAHEVVARQAVETRAAELEAELARLRAELADRRPD